MMREIIQITGTIPAGLTHESFIPLLEKAGFTNIKIESRPCFEDWLAKLPKDSIPGLNEQCRAWIRSWGNGGGDQSSEICITDTIRELGSDVPVELAETIYNSVNEYSKSDFQAIGLTIELIEGCLKELAEEADDNRPHAKSKSKFEITNTNNQVET